MYNSVDLHYPKAHMIQMWLYVIFLCDSKSWFYGAFMATALACESHVMEQRELYLWEQLVLRITMKSNHSQADLSHSKARYPSLTAQWYFLLSSAFVFHLYSVSCMRVGTQGMLLTLHDFRTRETALTHIALWISPAHQPACIITRSLWWL